MTAPDLERPGLGPWRSGAVAGFEPFPDADVESSLGARFEAVAARFADREALSSPAGTWTYASLLDEVRARAGYLEARFGSDDPQPVAVLAEHDGPLVAELLAVIAAGHVTVLLDPLAPEPALRHMVVESGARLLVHDAANADAAASLAASDGVETVALVDAVGAPVPFPAREGQSPAMIAFTSGTSGDPKGAVITHGLLLNLVRGATNALGISADDRMPMLFPTSMAVAAYPLFLPLLNGGTLATLDVRGVGFAPIGPFLQDERITVAYLAPTVVRFLAEALDGRTFPDLRMVALGGEGIDGDAVALTTELFAPTLIGLGYGTTETGVVSLGVIPPSTTPAVPVGCGYAVPDVELFVLDDRGEVLGGTEVGEIAVSSPYVFRGYLGHSELDGTVLSDDPRGRDGWRLYRTGDHGYLDADGALVVVGRVDTRVKVRGRFVVLGDVEADLHDLDEVAAGAVVARDADGVSELVAYVVPTSDDFDPAALRRRLLERRESYRVPSRWIVVDELPRLPNGKVDRRALPPVVDAPRPEAPALDVGVVSTLAEIWSGLLPVGPVGLDDDFADLGGDSLLAAQMLIRVEQRLGVTVPMGELVHRRTVRQLTELVVELRGTTGRPRSTACVQVGDPSSRPRLWFVPDLQGSAYRIRHIAAALGDDQPVWSFESPLLRGEPNTARNLEEFVAAFVADLRIEQPTGPYWLAGYSFGGVCAYEMARQLRAAGEDVAYLGVIDVGPGYRGPGWHGDRSPFRPWFGVAKPPEPDLSVADKARYYRDMFAASPARAARHLMVRSGLFRLVDPIRFRNDLRTHGRVRPAWRLWYAWEEHWKLAATAWDRGATYDGHVELFWADDTEATDDSLGWKPLVASYEVHRFAGDHIGILEPRGAQALAEAVRPTLDAAVT